MTSAERSGGGWNHTAPENERPVAYLTRPSHGKAIVVSRGHVVQVAVAAVAARDLAETLAVPALDERAQAARTRVVVGADRPHPLFRSRRDPGEVLKLGGRIGASDELPDVAVPVHDDRPMHTLRGDRADRPGVGRRDRNDVVEPKRIAASGR